MTSALDRLRDRKQANYRDIPICMDSGLVAQRESLKGEIARLQARARIKGNDDLDGQLSELGDELEELNGRIRAESEWIRVRALAPDDYQKLLDEHVPTKDQLREARKQHGPKATLSWNTDSFPDAILAASAYVLTIVDYDEDGKPQFEKHEDQFTLDFVREMRQSGTWSGGEVATLVNAAVTINESVANVGAAGKRVEADLQLREELRVCRQYQIPWSFFQGSKKLRWEPEDRAKAIAYEAYLAERCPRCGTRWDDFYEEDEDGNRVPLEEPMFYAVHSHCQGCEELGTVDSTLTDEQRKRGYHTRWVPAEELDDEDEPDEVAPSQTPDPKLPGLE